jgi:hypothetical protein
MSDKLQGIWKEEVLIFAWRVWGKPRKISVRIPGVSAEIRTKHLSYRSPEPYRYINSPGDPFHNPRVKLVWINGNKQFLLLNHLGLHGSLFLHFLSPYRSNLGRKVKQEVKCEIRTSVTMKNSVFWDVTSWRLVEVYRNFGGTYCLHLHSACLLLVTYSFFGLLFSPEREDSTFYRNVGNLISENKASHPSR